MIITAPDQLKLRKMRQKASNLRSHLKELTIVVDAALKAFDREMKKPSNEQRGKRIAKICNALQLQNDMAKRFGL